MVGDFVLGYKLTFIGRESLEIVTRVRNKRSSDGLRTHRKRITTVPVSMPSVEMRRTTRVFGARVLRSGRRLFTTQEALKQMRRPPLAAADDADDGWIELLDHGGDVDLKEIKGVDESMKEIQLEQVKEVNSIDLHLQDSNSGFGTENRRFGLVYSRKRKRIESSDCSNLDKRFGKKFFRKQFRKKIVTGISPSSPSVSPPNTATTTAAATTTTAEPRFFLKAKSKKKKMTRVSGAVSKPIRLNRVFQKRRSSFRLRRQRNPSTHVQDGLPFFPIKSNQEICKSIRRASFKELEKLTQDIDSASCNASILVIESDRCYRETGAVITMEKSGHNHWFLVVKRNGVERLRVEARTIMRPCFCNRVTNAIIWAGGDDRWKLEFPNRLDWFIFKELYKECSGRTVPVRTHTSLSSIIPVPRVNEVSGYINETFVPFKMPDSYISSRGDEVSRMLEKSDPVYEMDSDDDAWLSRYNNECDTPLDDDTFEKIVDAFERGVYCNPEDYSDVNTAVDWCSTLASKNVLEAVHGYWMARRKKKHSALIQVFQLYKPRKPEQLNLRAVLRKKRSFRQRGTQAGRGKQLTFLKAALFEKTKTEPADAEPTNTAKVEETAEAAKTAEESAMTRRKQAQVLMEVADLLTYKAAIAVKIAEARAAVVGSSSSVPDNNTIDVDVFLPAILSGFT